MRARSICLLGIGLYSLLSIADFVLTYTLIETSESGVYESNPVAAAYLENHGWLGLAMFKLGGVTVFVGAVGLLTARRPRLAAGVIGLGCAVLLGVTSYSYNLLKDARRELANRDAAWGKPERDPLKDVLVAWIPTR